MRYSDVLSVIRRELLRLVQPLADRRAEQRRLPERRLRVLHARHALGHETTTASSKRDQSRNPKSHRTCVENEEPDMRDVYCHCKKTVGTAATGKKHVYKH